MEVIYRADDGTEFNSEQECFEYETKSAELFDALKHEIFAYDHRGDFLDLGNWDPEDLEYAFDRISYITFTTQNAIDLFMSKANDFGQPYFENGINRQLVVGERYYYDEENEVWCCIEDKQRDLDELADIFTDK